MTVARTADCPSAIRRWRVSRILGSMAPPERSRRGLGTMSSGRLEGPLMPHSTDGGPARGVEPAVGRGLRPRPGRCGRATALRP